MVRVLQSLDVKVLSIITIFTSFLFITACDLAFPPQPGSFATQTVEESQSGMVKEAEKTIEKCNKRKELNGTSKPWPCDPGYLNCKRMYVNSFYNSLGNITERYIYASKVERECLQNERSKNKKSGE